MRNPITAIGKVESKMQKERRERKYENFVGPEENPIQQIELSGW